MTLTLAHESSGNLTNARSLARRALLVGVGAIFVCQLFDVGSTYYLMHHGLSADMNPLAELLIMGSFGWLLAVKALLVGTVGWRFVTRHYSPTHLLVLVCAVYLTVGFYACAGLGNFLAICGR